MKKTAFLALVLLLSSACTLIPKPGIPVTTYDFNSQPHTATHQLGQAGQPGGKTSKKISILLKPVAAPLWLDTQAIHYRLAYHNRSQAHAYAQSRWSSPPAFLLTQQINEKIAAQSDYLVIKDSSIAVAEYTLHIELEAFSQIFDTQDDSHVIMRFRASLINNAHRIIAQKTFSAIEPALTANAAGAVNAFSIAGNRLTIDLIHWLNSNLDNAIATPQ